MERIKIAILARAHPLIIGAAERAVSLTDGVSGEKRRASFLSRDVGAHVFHVSVKLSPRDRRAVAADRPR